jgi:hypothetical protein
VSFAAGDYGYDDSAAGDYGYDDSGEDVLRALGSAGGMDGATKATTAMTYLEATGDDVGAFLMDEQLMERV